MIAIESKIPNVSRLVKKADYKTKIREFEGNINNHNHDRYITTTEFNNLTAKVLDVRLKLANLVTKTDFDTQLKKNSDRVTSSKSNPGCSLFYGQRSP